MSTQDWPQLMILTCPWELRGMLTELGSEHETVEIVRTVEPGQERGSPTDDFWCFRPQPQSIMLWIRINGRFCPRAIEGCHLQIEGITEYFARREHLLRQEAEERRKPPPPIARFDSREGIFEGSGPDLDD